MLPGRKWHGQSPRSLRLVFVAIDTEVRLRVDLGENAPIEVVASVIGDISRVCVFGGELQRHVARNLALRQVLLRPGPFDDPELDYLLRERYPYGLWPASVFLTGLASQALEREITAFMAEYRLEEDADTLVRELTYRNPVEAALVLASGGVVLALLTLLRDWPSRRRINQAVARDYEDEVRARKRVRKTVTDALVGGELPLTPELIDHLLTDDTVRALDALGRADLSLQQQPTDGDPSSSQP